MLIAYQVVQFCRSFRWSVWIRDFQWCSC